MCTAATASERLTYVPKTYVSESVAEKPESGIVVFTYCSVIASNLEARGCSHGSRPQAGHSAQRCARWRMSRCRSCGPGDCRKISSYCPAQRRPAVELLLLRRQLPPAR